jgi:hypothetical protein
MAAPFATRACARISDTSDETALERLGSHGRHSDAVFVRRFRSTISAWAVRALQSTRWS